MPSDTVKPGLRTAMRLHEIGDKSPYQLFFAGKGKSGASFGFMQGDLAAGQAEVKATFRAVLADAGVPKGKATTLEAALSVHVISNPLSTADTKLVNAALASAQGRAKVDTMDEGILADIYRHLDKCLATAEAAGRVIEPKAQLYIAMWINMTGPPSTLLNWLAGKSVSMSKPIPKAGPTVTGEAMETYLGATAYYTENPGNMPHLLHCAAAGVAAMSSA